MSIRPVKSIIQSQPTIEGAGVKLRRAFGFGDTGDFDPFLLLDDFRNEHPQDYLAGFPWHPHRGIETITYVLHGTVQHGDSLGNRGAMGPGDVQWMTAGSGILHQEMPKGDDAGRMHGFQLWANLPKSLKMTDPRYQDILAKDIPEVVDDDGTRVRVICGEFWGKTGPVEGVAADPRYLDVWVPPGVQKSFQSNPPATPSPTSSRAAARSGMRRRRAACSPSGWGRESPGRRCLSRRAIARSCCSIRATRSPSRQERRGSASCSSRGGRSRSLWPGGDRS